MASKDLIVAPKAVAFSRVTEPGPASWKGPDSEPLLIRAATRAGDVRRAMPRVMHDLRYRPPKARTAKLLVLIPAYNEESSIGNVLNALLTQTRVPDRIVVVADNCTDKTEQIARRFRGVTVMRTVGNTERKVGALNRAGCAGRPAMTMWPASTPTRSWPRTACSSSRRSWPSRRGPAA